MKHIDLSHIKQKATKSGKVYYYWKDSIGKKIPFNYNDNKGDFILMDITPENDALLEYEGRQFTINTKYLKKCMLNTIFPSVHWIYVIGQEIKDTKRNLTITNTKYKKSNTIRRNKYYAYKCNNCGFDSEQYGYWINESGLLNGIGCACCSNNFVAKGINDVATTDPWMLPFFYNKEDAYNCTKGSNKKVIGMCPNCGATKDTTVQRIYHKTFSCDICSRAGGSMGERFLANLLLESNINFIRQLTNKTFSWVSSFRYDFYLKDLKWIVEIHGNQHYEELTFKSRNLKEEQANDQLKQQLAEKYVDNYIILPYLDSDIQKLLEEIHNSPLDDIILWDQIDINTIYKTIEKSIMAEICAYYNSCEDKPTTTEIANKFGLVQTTVHRYLVRGTKEGLCDFNSKKQMQYYRHYRSNPISIEQNGIQYIFARRSEINKINLSPKMISKYCDTNIRSRDGYLIKSITKREFNDKCDESLINNKIIIYGEKFPQIMLGEA